MAALVGYDALDWFLRVYCPLWLDAIGAVKTAADVRALPRIADEAAFSSARLAVLGAISTAWNGQKEIAGAKFADALAYYAEKGIDARRGFEALEKAAADAKVARDPKAPPAGLFAWRKAALLVLHSGGTQALDSLSAAARAELAKVTLG